jgi:hypothetical protein
MRINLKITLLAIPEIHCHGSRPARTLAFPPVDIDYPIRGIMTEREAGLSGAMLPANTELEAIGPLRLRDAVEDGGDKLRITIRSNRNKNLRPALERKPSI